MATEPDRMVRWLDEAQRHVEREVVVTVRELGVAMPVTPAQGRVLRMISPAGTNVSSLADHARITKQALSQLAHALEANGLVSSQTLPDDRRHRLLHRTQAGDEACDALDALMTEVEKRLEKRLGTDLFNSVAEGLRALGASTTAEPLMSTSSD